MNLMQLKPGSVILALLIILNSCSSDSDEEMDPCINGPEITVDELMVSVEGMATGEIIVSASGGSAPYMYSIDGMNFQGNGTFSGLEGGSYMITIRDANECSATENVTIEEVPEVSYMDQIRPIIDANCQISGCHGSNSNIPSWATYEDVKARAAAIKTRTGNRSMPQNGTLEDEEIQLIADWVDQGAPNN